jgi:Flp pilus assembly protein TadD
VAQEDARAAEEAYLKAIELAPRHLDSYVRLGALYAGAGRYDEALARLGEAARVNPRNPGTAMMLGIVHEQRGDIAKARGAYEKALSLNPRFVPAANNLAWIYTEYGGDQDRALSLAEMARRVAPDDPRVADTLGWILYRRGLHHRALDLLKESASKLPDNPQVQYHLGMTYAKLGDSRSARDSLTAAVNSREKFAGKDEAAKTLSGLQ